MTITMFEVGGCVRDSLLGIPSKDIDFSVEAPSFDAMREFLVNEGFTIFTEAGEFLTIRAHFPRSHPEHGKTTADFVLCRKERGSLDGRHPESVEPGTIFDDLARRDFTVNAMARRLRADGTTGPLLDPHNGHADLAAMTLRFVGNPQERIKEDALRVLRAVRFVVTKGFSLAPQTQLALSLFDLDLLAAISTERIKDEMEKCFRFSTITTMRLLDDLGLFDVLFRRMGIRLTTTMKG